MAVSNEAQPELGGNFTPTRENVHLTLEELSIFFPSEPISINGEPHLFTYDPDDLVSHIRTANRYSSRTTHQVHGISFTYSSSLPDFFEQGRSETDPLLYDPKDEMIVCRIPREVASSDQSTEELTYAYNYSLNKQFKLGLLQSVGMRQAMNSRTELAQAAIWGGLVGGTAIGASGLVSGEKPDERVGAAFAGMAIGAAVGFIPALFEVINDMRKRPDGDVHLSNPAKRYARKPNAFVPPGLQSLAKKSVFLLVPESQTY